MKIADFTYDLFISYARENDGPLEGDRPGWVEDLSKCLVFRLTQLSGTPPRLLSLASSQNPPKLEEGLSQVAFFVAILSPDYLREEYLRDIERFSSAASQQGSLQPGGKSRFFKVVRKPLSAQQHPEALRQLLSYEFFGRDPHTEELIEFDRSPATEREFWNRVGDLARAIHEARKAWEQSAGADSIPTRPSVYLAETGYDRRQEYYEIKRQLESQNFVVQPDRQLPLGAVEYRKCVQEVLSRCALSIHLIGSDPGRTPVDSEVAGVQLQNSIAAECSRLLGLRRLIWMPGQLQVDDESQKRFVDSLHTDATALTGADLLEAPLEDLKKEIRSNLQAADIQGALTQQASQKDLQAAEEAKGDETQLEIYLVCDQRDLEAVVPLRKFLQTRVRVTLPEFSGNVKTVRKAHEDRLRQCDAVAVYYGAGNILWLRAKLREISKIAGQGRVKEFLARLIYIGPPHTDEKEQYATGEAQIVCNFETFDPGLMEPFLSEVQQMREDRADE
jgi:hypothetical protein